MADLLLSLREILRSPG